MTPLFLLAAALTDISGDAARTAACKALIKSDMLAAVDQATAWAERDKSVPARQCLGLAFVAVERWAPAQSALEQAAAQAEAQHDGRAAPVRPIVLRDDEDPQDALRRCHSSSMTSAQS